MREKKLKDIENLIVLLFSVLPIIDSLNGMFIVEGVWSSLGTIYKMAIVFVLFVIVLVYERFSIRFLLLLMSTVFYVVFSVVLNMMLGVTKVSYDHSIKLVFNILIMILLLQLCKIDVIEGKTFFRIFDNSVSLMIICMLVPYVLGVGYTIYSSGIGYKGFFYSQNELNAVLIMLFGFCLYKNICKITVYSSIQLLAIMVCVLLMSSKSSMLACCLGLAIFVFEYLRRKGNRHKIAIIVSSMLIVLCGMGFVLAQIQGFFDRQSSLYKTYNSDIIATITSGRTIFLEVAFDDFIHEKNMPIRLLLGNGFESKHLVEMDFFDIFFYLGLIGLCLLLIGLVVVFFKSRKNVIKDRTIIRYFNYFLILGFAFLTGHVIFMATAGCYFVLLCCFNMKYCIEE